MPDEAGERSPSDACATYGFRAEDELIWVPEVQIWESLYPERRSATRGWSSRDGKIHDALGKFVSS